MKLSKALQAFMDDAQKTDSYWEEAAKLDFSLELERRRRLAGITYAAIAKKIGVSAAYITKVFRGDANLTIGSMVKLSRATGAKLQIHLVDDHINVNPGVWAAKISGMQEAANSHDCVTMAYGRSTVATKWLREHRHG